MPNFVVFVSGWESVQARFIAVGRNCYESRVTIRRRIPVMRDKMKQRAPVLTGFLRNNIVSGENAEGGWIESRAPYSGYVNRGTSRMAPQPFFDSVLMEEVPVVRQEVKRTVIR